MSFLHLVLSNMRRKKVRTAFTLLSLFVSFVLFGFLMAVRAGFGVGVELAGIDRLVMLHKVSLIQPLPYAYLNRILADEDVEAVAHLAFERLGVGLPLLDPAAGKLPQQRQDGVRAPLGDEVTALPLDDGCHHPDDRSLAHVPLGCRPLR